MGFLDIIEDKKKEARAEGRAEGKVEERVDSILDILSTHGSIPESMKEQLMNISDMDILKSLTFSAIKVNSIEEFAKELHKVTR